MDSRQQIDLINVLNNSKFYTLLKKKCEQFNCIILIFFNLL